MGQMLIGSVIYMSGKLIFCQYILPYVEDFEEDTHGYTSYFDVTLSQSEYKIEGKTTSNVKGRGIKGVPKSRKWYTISL
jgi:hypothetical protein